MHCRVQLIRGADYTARRPYRACFYFRSIAIDDWVGTMAGLITLIRMRGSLLTQTCQHVMLRNLFSGISLVLGLLASLGTANCLGDTVSKPTRLYGLGDPRVIVVSPDHQYLASAGDRKSTRLNSSHSQ